MMQGGQVHADLEVVECRRVRDRVRCALRTIKIIA